MASASPASPSTAPPASPSALATASASSQFAALVVFNTTFLYPLGFDGSTPTPAALALALLAFRCDTSAATGVVLGAIRVTSGILGNTSVSPAVVDDAIRAANLGTACPGARVLLPLGDARALAASTGTFLALAASVGVSGTAAAAATVAAAIAAAAFPLTAAAWAPLWGYSAATWAATFGVPPLRVVAGSIAIINVASFSPLPAPFVGALTASQQLGLGLGIGLALALIAIVGVALFARAAKRTVSNLRVVAVTV